MIIKTSINKEDLLSIKKTIKNSPIKIKLGYLEKLKFILDKTRDDLACG